MAEQFADADPELACDACGAVNTPVAVYKHESGARLALCYACLQGDADALMGKIESSERAAYTHPDGAPTPPGEED